MFSNDLALLDTLGNEGISFCNYIDFPFLPLYNIRCKCKSFAIRKKKCCKEEGSLKKTKIALALFLIICISAFAVGCAKNKDAAKTDAEKQGNLKIYTTFYPLYDFTKKIVGDNAQVESLIPAGVEPHDFELSPKQTAKIYDGDIFIFLGESMEPWAAKIAEDLSKNGVNVLEVGTGLIQDNDPHIWLDPVLAKDMAKKIFEKIAAQDPKHEEIYQQNLNSLLEKLDELDKKLAEATSKSLKKDVVTSHAFLSYMAKRYGFNQISITGLSPQDEPSPKKIAEIVNIVKSKGVKYILVEKGSSSKLPETVANEAGAQILTINPLETLWPDEIEAGEDYFSVMEKNLDVLRQALEYESK